jgi:hypothetical protein
MRWWLILRACLDFVFGISYRPFYSQLRLEKRSLAEPNEYFYNEKWQEPARPAGGKSHNKTKG